MTGQEWDVSCSPLALFGVKFFLFLRGGCPSAAFLSARAPLLLSTSLWLTIRDEERSRDVPFIIFSFPGLHVTANPLGMM